MDVVLVLITLPSGTLASILPLKHQSAGLTFNDWVSLLTLCFAPLIAHVIAGVPIIVYLSPKRPTWSQRLVLYNPVTITWRYFAVADLRIRTKEWSPSRLALCNVYFWTHGGWDGSEARIDERDAFLVTLPQSTHAELLSGSTLKTIIVTLQGAQSLSYLVWSNFTTSNNNWNATLSIASLFTPLAVLGLLRLAACFWLTDDFVYVACEETQTTIRELVNQREQEARVDLATIRRRARNHARPHIARIEDPYRGIRSWLSWLLRMVFLCIILGLTALSIWNLIPTFLPTVAYTATLFGTLLCYTLFMSTGSLIFGYYFLRSRNTTTVLPCISSQWYQAYTIILYFSLTVLIMIAALENWKTPCGLFTTYPPERSVCNNTTPVVGQW